MTAEVNYLRSTVVCFSGGLLVGFQFLLQGMPSIVVKELQQDLNIGLTEISILSSSMLYLYVFLQLYAGKVAGRFGERRCLIVSLTMMIILCVSFSLVTNYYSALIIRIAMGAFASPGVICCMMLISRWFSPRYFAMIIGIWESINMCIAGMVPGILGRLSPIYGWRIVMLLIASLGLLFLIINILFVRNRPFKSLQEKSSSGLTINEWKLLLKMPIFWCSCIFCFGVFAVVNVFASLWAVPFIQVKYADNPEIAVQFTAMIFFGIAVGAPLTGMLSSLLNRTRIVMFLSILIGILCMSLLMYVKMNLLCAGIIMFFFGCGCSVYMLPFSMLRECLPMKWLYTTNALLNGCCISAAPSFQPLVGKLLEWHASNPLSLQLDDFYFALLPIYIMLWVALISLMGMKFNKNYLNKCL